AFIPNVPSITGNTPVAELFGVVAAPPCPLPVVDEDGKYLGVISRTTMLKFLDRDTPPVPPPQKEIPTIKLDTSVPSGVMAAHTAQATAPAQQAQ
ncbi:MAG: CBS domain-containing protein, partial [Comamonas sp.]